MSIFKQGKLSKPEFVSKVICALLSILVFGLVTSLGFPGDSPGDYGVMHTAFNWVFGVLMFLYIVILMRKSLDENLEFDFAEDDGNGRYYAGTGTLIIALVFLIFGTQAYDKSKYIYNTAQKNLNVEIQYKQEKETFYDNYWKSYQLTDNVVIQNKETLLEVTNIVMNARKDGEQLTWKWLQENQPIPFSEFTKFYSGLIDFIQSQRAGLLAIENKHQQLSQEHNTLLKTFPNNLYNKVLDIPYIQYKPGFTSTKTQEVFSTGIENLN